MGEKAEYEPITLEEGATIEEFAEIAEEKARGHGLLENPQDVDLALVELSATYIDPDGILRKFTIHAEGFDPEEHDEGGDE